MSYRLVLVVGGLVLSGCFDATAYNAARVADLRQQAAFAMECPESELAVSPLRHGDGLQIRGDVVMSYGVAGCGRRVVYLLEPYTATWMADTAGGERVESSAP